MVPVGSDPDLAAVAFDDGAADRQPDAHAAWLGAVERFEQPLGSLRVHSDSCVLDRQSHAVVRVVLGLGGVATVDGGLGLRGALPTLVKPVTIASAAASGPCPAAGELTLIM